MKNFYLKYAANCYIKIQFPLPFRHVWLITKPSVYFCWHEVKYELHAIDMKWFLDDVIPLFTDLLSNKKTLNKELLEGEEIGLIYNKIENPSVKIEDYQDSWSGFTYIAWLATVKDLYFTIWLYNNEKGEIVLHITQKYDEDMEKVGITYQDFMQNYKPVLTEVIPHQVISIWLDQCKMLYKQLQENEKWWDEVEHPRLKAAGKCKECKAEAKNK